MHADEQPAYDRDGRPAMVVRGFRLERVFRYEDTEGEPLPEVPEVGYVTGDILDGARGALAALVERDGYRLTGEPETVGARGHTNCMERFVNIDPAPSAAEQVHVLIHELGHIRADHDTRREVSWAQRETEAESVAFIVATVLGLHVGDVAAVHVGGWTDGDPETITATQAAIHHTAHSILADLEQDQPDHEDTQDGESEAG